MNSVVKRLGDLLAVVGFAEHRRFVSVRHATDFREDGRHLGRDEHDERCAFHAPVLKARVGAAQLTEELLLNFCGELLRLVAASVGINAVQQLRRSAIE